MNEHASGILLALAAAPLPERDAIARVGDPEAGSNAFAFLDQMRYIRPDGLRWRLTDAGREQAVALGVVFPEPEPEPAPAPKAPLRVAGSARALATPKPKAERKPKPERAPRPKVERVPKAPKAPKAPRQLSMTPAAIKARDLWQRKKAAKEAGVEFVPQPNRFRPSDTPSPRALYLRDLAARKQAAADAGVPFQPKPRGRGRTTNPAPGTVKYWDWKERKDRAEETGQPMERKRRGPPPNPNPTPSQVRSRRAHARRQAKKATQKSVAESSDAELLRGIARLMPDHIAERMVGIADNLRMKEE